MTATTYCTTTETQFILSSAGQAAFLDDNEDGSADADVLSAIEMASVDMNELLYARYKPADLPVVTSNGTVASTNNWLKWTNARLAAAVICERRLLPLPDSLSKEIERLWDFMKRLAGGDPAVLIPGIANSLSYSPTVSNSDVQRGRYRQPVRVSVQESTGTAPPGTLMRPITVDPYP